MRAPRSYMLRRIARMAHSGYLGELLALSHAAVLRKWYSSRLSPFPCTLLVETTRVCQLNCVTCPNPDLPDSDRGQMSLALFESICDQIKPYRSFVSELIFRGLGEPLLHPRLPEMVRMAKAIGLPEIRVTTNALALDRTKISRLIDAGLDELSISLDAVSADTYQAIKGRDLFERAEANVRSFLEVRGGRVKPFLRLQILSMPENGEERKKFLSLWLPRLHGGDYVKIKPLHSFAGQVKDLLPDPAVLRTPAVDPHRGPCRQLWGLLLITWNGEVQPCCMDVLRHFITGNCSRQTLSEIWRSAEMEYLRNLHRAGLWNSDPLCRDCESWWFLDVGPTKTTPKQA